MSSFKLPVEMWREVIEVCGSLRVELSHLVLVNKKLYELVLPVMFRRIELQNDPKKHPFSLQHTIDRVKSLSDSPHLIQHVRIVRLEAFETPYNQLHRPLWASSYNAVIELLAKLPNIRNLELMRCTITPELHSFVYNKPPFKSLYAVCCSWPPLHNALFEGQPDMHLEALQYYPDLGPWRAGILQNCLGSLSCLSVRVNEVRHVLSSAQGRQLSLRTLEIAEGLHGNEQDPVGTYKLLMLCPGLRKFYPAGTIQVDLRKVSVHDLLHLEEVWGSLSIIQELVPGRLVHSVKVVEYTVDSEDSIVNTFMDSDVNTSRESPSVKTLEYDLGPNSHGQIMRLSQLFPNASCVFFRVMASEPEFKVFTNVLLRWPNVKVFYLGGAVSMKAARKAFQSFIGPLGVPAATRVHLKLEEVNLGDNFVWRWHSAEGWSLYDHFIDDTPWKMSVLAHAHDRDKPTD